MTALAPHKPNTPGVSWSRSAPGTATLRSIGARLASVGELQQALLEPRATGAPQCLRDQPQYVAPEVAVHAARRAQQLLEDALLHDAPRRRPERRLGAGDRQRRGIGDVARVMLWFHGGIDGHLIETVGPGVVGPALGLVGLVAAAKRHVVHAAPQHEQIAVRHLRTDRMAEMLERAMQQQHLVVDLAVVHAAYRFGQRLERQAAQGAHVVQPEYAAAAEIEIAAAAVPPLPAAQRQLHVLHLWLQDSQQALLSQHVVPRHSARLQAHVSAAAHSDGADVLFGQSPETAVRRLEGIRLHVRRVEQVAAEHHERGTLLDRIVHHMPELFGDLGGQPWVGWIGIPKARVGHVDEARAHLTVRVVARGDRYSLRRIWLRPPRRRDLLAAACSCSAEWRSCWCSCWAWARV